MLGYTETVRWPARRLIADLALTFGLCTALGWMAVVLARMPGTVAVIWWANGAAIALVLSAPRERSLSLMAAAVAGNLAANLAYGDPLHLSLAFLLPNAAEVALGVWLVRRTGLAHRFSEDHRSLIWVLGAAVFVPPALGATLGAGTLQALGFAPFLRVWPDWYVGDLLGGLATVPLVLSLRALDGRDTSRRLATWGSLAVQLALLLVTVAAALWLPYPFVASGVVLLAIAFTRPRVETFAASLVFVGCLAVLVATDVLVTAKTPEDGALLLTSAVLTVLPAQLVAVVVARQRALSQTLAAVGSRLNDIVTFTDLDGSLRWVNQAREIYWGVPNSEVLGRVPDETLPSDFRENVFKPMFAEAVQGQLVRRRMDLTYPAAGLRTMDMTMQPAHDEDGRLIGVLYCASDVTDIEASRRALAHTADALRASNESLEQFVRIAAHDLREPLNTIAQFCSLIEQREAARMDATSALYFSHVRTGALRMKTMLDDVLQLVRLDQGQAPSPESVDLDALLRDVAEGLHARIQAQGAQLDVGPLGTVRGHRALLMLLAQNLISNALKFVPPGRTPHVRVWAERTAGQLRLSVTDNGIGIDPKRIGELGTPFRRLHARRKYEGTGLGLSICNRIAALHGGNLDIRSVPDQGSSFTLVMPLA